MIAAKDLGIPDDKLNVNGGATALGHPIGASGARIIATLLAALENRGLKRGVAARCLGGGRGAAIAVALNLILKSGGWRDRKSAGEGKSVSSRLDRGRSWFLK